MTAATEEVVLQPVPEVVPPALGRLVPQLAEPLLLGAVAKAERLLWPAVLRKVQRVQREPQQQLAVGSMVAALPVRRVLPVLLPRVAVQSLQESRVLRLVLLREQRGHQERRLRQRWDR